MKYSIKTSDSKWLEKAIELFMNRTNMHILDDSGYGISENSEFIKFFHKITLNPTMFLILSGLFSLGFVAIIVIFILLLFAAHINDKSILLYLIPSTLCVVIPIYFFRKNRPPKITVHQNEVEIIFT
jgi:hypothetical protein